MLDTKTSCMQPSAKESETEPVCIGKLVPFEEFTCSKLNSSRCSMNLDMMQNIDQMPLNRNTWCKTLTSAWQCPNTCLCWPWSPLCCTPCNLPAGSFAAVSHSSLSLFSHPSLVSPPPSPMEGMFPRMAWDWMDEMEKTDGMDERAHGMDFPLTFKMMLHRHSSFSFLIYVPFWPISFPADHSNSTQVDHIKQPNLQEFLKIQKTSGYEILLA